jgi:hypothetical protein|tara:strand:+ start:21029 stop:21238 length:210 start_codon:yes stop_codon:yes gene_type:complete
MITLQLRGQFLPLTRFPFKADIVYKVSYRLYGKIKDLFYEIGITAFFYSILMYEQMLALLIDPLVSDQL